MPPPQFNHTPYNPSGYGRMTPLLQGMNNLPPPLGQQLPSWNINPHVLPPSTPQAPQSSTNFTASIHNPNATFPYQMNNANQRNQFQPPLAPHPLACPAPRIQFSMQPNPYGHQPTSQYMIPQMFQGDDMIHHQGCAIPGGPPSAPHNDAFYLNHQMEQQLRHMQNVPLNMAPGHQNQRGAPLPPQSHCPKQETGILQNRNNYQWRYNRPETQLYHHKGIPNPRAREVKQGMYDQWAPAPSPRSDEYSSHLLEPTSRGNGSHSPTRWTPARNILERNTAPYFDESSEELAEIFADKPNKAARGSDNCSDNSSVHTTSSSAYIFYSDDDGADVMPNIDNEMGSKKVFSEGTFKRDHAQGSYQKNSLNQYNATNSCSANNYSAQAIKPPPGFLHLNEPEQPPADQLQKVGNFLKGLLKVDGNHSHGNAQSKPVSVQDRGPERKSKSPGDVSTIRSLIDRPIYNNCESRLMNKNVEVSQKQKPDASVLSCTSNTVKRINIRRITSHFRVLFDPIPDLFGEA